MRAKQPRKTGFSRVAIRRRQSSSLRTSRATALPRVGLRTFFREQRPVVPKRLDIEELEPEEDPEKTFPWRRPTHRGRKGGTSRRPAHLKLIGWNHVVGGQLADGPGDTVVGSLRPTRRATSPGSCVFSVLTSRYPFVCSKKTRPQWTGNPRVSDPNSPSLDLLSTRALHGGRSPIPRRSRFVQWRFFEGLERHFAAPVADVARSRPASLQDLTSCGVWLRRPVEARGVGGRAPFSHGRGQGLTWVGHHTRHILGILGTLSGCRVCPKYSVETRLHDGITRSVGTST